MRFGSFKPQAKCPCCGSTTHSEYLPGIPCGWQEDQLVPKEGHGLPPNVRFALLQAIEEFLPRAREEWDTPEKAEDNCNHASDEFLWTLHRFGIEGLIEHYEPDLHLMDIEDYPYDFTGRCQYHWAVRLGNIIIDWTARQFNEHAGLPAVWISEPRDWRNVTD